MKYNFFCIFLIVSVILGCTKSQIKDSLKEHSRANQYTSATVFPINLESKEFAACVQEELKEDLQYLKFVSGDKFREAMFPWFEPNTAPQNIEELSALLRKTLVQKRIESFGVEILIYVHGYTKSYDESFGDIPYFMIMGSNERETHIRTTVWDLKEIVRVGDTDISFQGTVYGGITSIPPFVFIIPAFTESSACNETAKRISNCLTGKVSPTDK
ncbi:MAG: hypothetical protein MUP22_14310 [Desulfobacterales bacterium]|jgi:hypothetical protein|nr:hypothetical protein [Desulfobacterales bacterium]